MKAAAVALVAAMLCGCTSNSDNGGSTCWNEATPVRFLGGFPRDGGAPAVGAPPDSGFPQCQSYGSYEFGTVVPNWDAATPLPIDVCLDVPCHGGCGILPPCRAATDDPEVRDGGVVRYVLCAPWSGQICAP